MSGLFGAIVASLVAGLAAGVGGLPVIVVDHLDERGHALLLGSGAGVMLGASLFSLCLPGFELGTAMYGGPGPSATMLAVSVLAGAFTVAMGHRVVPHAHPKGGPEGPRSTMSTHVLLALGIAIHNLPEGLAVGVGFASDDMQISAPLAIGIALHNLPEGLVVAMAARTEGSTRQHAIWLALLTGLVEPIGAIGGYLGASMVAAALPFGLGFAAGAMLYVVSDEIIPESHHVDSGAATWGTLIGFVVMVLLVGWLADVPRGRRVEKTPSWPGVSRLPSILDGETILHRPPGHVGFGLQLGDSA